MICRMIDITETELEEVLKKFKDLVEGDRYTISSGENREKNDNFITNNFLTRKIKKMLLELTTKDCISVEKHYRDNEKIVYKFIKEYNINTKENNNLKAYIKFMICLVRCQEHVIIISFHETVREEKYLFK